MDTRPAVLQAPRTWVLSLLSREGGIKAWHYYRNGSDDVWEGMGTWHSKHLFGVKLF